MIAIIVYMDKRTLKKSEVSFREVVDIDHAKQVAKKLRPRFHKIVSVSVSIAVDLHESDS